jgi:signal peptidase
MSVPTARIKKELIDVGIAVVIFLLIQGALYAVLGVFPPYRAISSGSMEPVYYEGDVVVIKKVDPSELKVGDIIVFEAVGGGIPIVHRIEEIIEEDDALYFVTKGDNNPFQDTYYSPGVPGPKVIGTPVLKIPKVGWISIWFRRLL